MHTTSSLRFLVFCSILTLTACGEPEEPTTVPGGASAQVEAEAGDEGETMTISMRNLLKLGKNYTCTMKIPEDAGMEGEGTFYVNGEKNFRGQFTVEDQSGKKMHSNIIMTNNTSYIWSDDQPEGIMMRLSTEDNHTLWGSQEGSGNDGIVDEDEEVEMKCKRWSPNKSMFSPPSDRRFVDFQAQMDAMMGGNACSSCDQVPDAAAKAECKKALGC